MYVVVNVATAAASCGAIDPTNVILLGAPSTSAPVASTSSEPIEHDADNEGSFSFGSLHAALGQGFVQDRLKRRQEKEQQQEEEEGQLREKTPTTVEETRTTVVVDAIQLATVSSSSDDSKENDPGLLSST